MDQINPLLNQSGWFNLPYSLLKPNIWNQDEIYSNECYISFKISFR